MEEAREELEKKWGQAMKMEWLRFRFSRVTDSWSDVQINYVVRGYLLYILGCTLFVDKTGTWVPICFLTLPWDLNKVRTYARGAKALAYLYCQLEISNRIEMKQLAGYVTLF